MDRPAITSRTNHETAMPPRVLGIALDNFAMLNYIPHLSVADHPFRSRHLLDSVWQKQKLAAA